MKDLLYEVESVRRFAGLRLFDALSDETTILNFRRLLERIDSREALFEEINAHLASRGRRRLRTGTIMDASIIKALVDEETGGRNPEMRKGKQWHFSIEDAHRRG